MNHYVAITPDYTAPINSDFARATRRETTIALEAKWGTDAQQNAILQAAIDAQMEAYQTAIAEFNALQSPYTRPVFGADFGASAGGLGSGGTAP